MKTGTRLLILCLLAPAALAENMSLRSGRVLKDAVVVSSGDDFVNIQYTDGVAKVSYKDLTDAQQRDYRMTPDEVKARLDQPGRYGNPCLRRSGIPATWKGRIFPACFC